jgi:polyphenol oxidase
VMLEMVTSDLLAPVRHGFFTRRGGASSGIFAGLNCGPGSTDLSEVVEINRTRVAGAMGVSNGHLLTLNQIHSDRALPVTAPFDERPGADGMLSPC